MAAGMVGVAGRDVEGPAVPWARDDRAGERSVGEGPAPVRADGVDREDLAVDVEEGHRLVEKAHDELGGPPPDLGEVRDPDERRAGGRALGAPGLPPRAGR